MIGKCQLYLREEELLNSHIIPKFTFDFLKKSGGTYLRAWNNPNLRLQDGPKKHLLCAEAEQEFGKRERWFANNIFFPYQKGEKKSFDYDENLGYFVISVLWRVLTEHLSSDLAGNEFSFLTEVGEEWRQFLADGVIPKTYTDLNFFLTDRIGDFPKAYKVSDAYLSRGIDSTIMFTKDFETVGVYVKFMRFVVWSIVKGKPTEGKGIKINFERGNLGAPQIIDDDFFGKYLLFRMNQIHSFEKMNEEQEQKVIQEIIKNEDEFWKSDAGQAMMNDYRLTQ